VVDNGRPVDGRRKKRGKAPIKYRGPKRGEKWSGRGMTPLWLQAYIKAGKKKESFLVS
jgi:DNA-binding protein H-NS